MWYWLTMDIGLFLLTAAQRMGLFQGALFIMQVYLLLLGTEPDILCYLNLAIAQGIVQAQQLTLKRESSEITTKRRKGTTTIQHDHIH